MSTDYKYISFDIETAGLEPGYHSVLEFGAVLDDFETPVEKLPTFRCLVDNETIVGNSYALGMHVDSGILKELQNGDPKEGQILKPDEVESAVACWLYDNGYKGGEDFLGSVEEAVSQYTFTAAGKNVASFDIPHVEESLGFGDTIRFHHRVLDPGPMYYDPEKDGDTVPNLSTCLERAGLDDEIAHTGVEDSKDVIRLIRLDKGYDLE